MILRAFKESGELDPTGTNRISRLHLLLRFEERRVSVRDPKSAFHTYAGPPGKIAQIPHNVDFELPGEFELGFAEAAVRLRGRVFAGANGAPESVRLARPDDEAAHHYVLVRSKTLAGSDEKTSGLLLENARAATAVIEADAQSRFWMRATAPGVAVDGRALTPGGAPVLLTDADLVKLGESELEVREAKEDDFLRPAKTK